MSEYTGIINYALSMRDNVYTIQLQNEYITVEELTNIIQGLQHTLSLLNMKQTYQQIERDAALKMLITIAKNATWLFGNSLNGFQYYPKKQRSVHSHSGECVYFMSHAIYPGFVKIGRSIDVYQRMKALNQEYKNKTATLLAIAQTSQYIQLERLFHKYFEDKRLIGEFFELTSMDVEFIKGLAKQ